MNLHADIYPIMVFNNEGWLISGEDNFLYKINLNNWEANFIAKVGLNSKEISWRGNYVSLIHKNKLICLPNKSNMIAIYQIEDKKLEYVHMPQNISNNWNIFAHILDEDNLFLFSKKENMIIRFSFELEEVDIYDCVEKDKEIIHVLSKDDKFLFITKEESLYLYSYNVSNKKLDKTFIADELYEMMCCDGENIWFSGKRKEILLWNRNLNYKKEIDISAVDICQYDYVSPTKDSLIIEAGEKEFNCRIFYKQFVHGDYVWFFPYLTNSIIRINRNNYNVQKIELENEIEDVNSLSGRRNGLNSYKYFFEFIDNQNDLYVYSFKNQIHYKIDYISGIMKEVKGEIDIINEKAVINKLLEADKIQYERVDFSLKQLLKIYR